MSVKKHIVRLSQSEQEFLQELIQQRKGSKEEVRRANILLSADENGPNLPDNRIARQLVCRQQTVYNVRTRFVRGGIEEALYRKAKATPPTSSTSVATESQMPP